MSTDDRPREPRDGSATSDTNDPGRLNGTSHTTDTSDTSDTSDTTDTSQTMSGETSTMSHDDSTNASQHSDPLADPPADPPADPLAAPQADPDATTTIPAAATQALPTPSPFRVEPPAPVPDDVVTDAHQLPHLAPPAPAQPAYQDPRPALVTVRKGPRPGTIMFGLLTMIVAGWLLAANLTDADLTFRLVGPPMIGAFGAMLLIVGLAGVVAGRLRR
ncbi:MAG: hypothetical protein ACKOVB_02445 [Terrabacter sp.]